jgi:dTMP kinase
MLGRFIVVEGLEGAGKTTAIETIKNYFESQSQSVIVTREPGGTRIGEGLRALIKSSVDGEFLDARCELLMMYAARVQLLQQVIRPALNRGDWVIADRFELSTYAYQGGGRGISKHTLDCLSTICLDQFKPDLILFLDISPEQGLERAKGRGKLDRIEQESKVFFTNVYDGYHENIKNMNNVRIIDASLPLDAVQKSIIVQLNQFLCAH